MNKFTTENLTLIFSKKWRIRIPAGTELTQEILEEYQKNLYLLDNHELSAMVLPSHWELIAN